MRDQGQERPIVNGDYLLRKYPGKGGWTYAEIPEVLQNPQNPFGWVCVRGSIDGFELNHYKLMPMGNGRLFLPVNTQVRKHIGKVSGDFVKIILYPDDQALEIPEEITECLEMESHGTLRQFQGLTDGEKKSWLDWIYGTRSMETRAHRINQMIELLGKGERRHH